MIAPEYFNNHIAVEGEIIVKGVPNDTGHVLVWNPATKKISRRTPSEIVSDLNVITTHTVQEITGSKYFITQGGNNYANHALQVRSYDGSNPGITFYKNGTNTATIQYTDGNFSFTNTDISDYSYATAKGFKKEGSSDNFFLTGSGGDYDSRRKEDSWFHSGRNFPQGTLIETDIDYSVTSGDQFLLEMKGNMYGGGNPLIANIQGYIYADTLYSVSGYSTLYYWNSIIALNLNGKLCFWFQSLSYWQGFDVKVTVGYGGLDQGRNRVTFVSDHPDPGGTKRVQINLKHLLTKEELISGNTFWEKKNVDDYYALDSDKPIAGLNGNGAQVILSGGLLASDTYLDKAYIPANGIHSKGSVQSDEGFVNRYYKVDQRNRIWNFGDSTAWGLSYFQGSYHALGEGISFHFGDGSDYKFFVKDNGNIYTKNDIISGNNFYGKGLYSPVVAGGQVIQAGNSNDIYFGNTVVTNVYFESGNSNLLHNRSGYGVGIVWDQHNFNPENYIPISHPVYGITSAEMNGWRSFAGYWDNRNIQPAHLGTQKLQIGFANWFNNGDQASHYADYLHFGGYQDFSGGNQNLIMFSKAGPGLRQWQGSPQGVSKYQFYVDYWHSGDFTQTEVNSWNSIVANSSNFVTLHTGQTVIAKKTFAGGDGNGYTGAAIMINGNGHTDTVYPTISFHQPGLYAGTVSYRGTGYGFYFMDINGNGFENVSANGFYKSGSSNEYILLGSGGHKAVSDFATVSQLGSFVTTNTNQDITGQKLFINNTGSNAWSENRLVAWGNNGSKGAISFFSGGMDTGVIEFDGYYNFKNSGGFTNLKANAFIKEGSDNSYVLLGGGGQKPMSDFVTPANLNDYLPKAGGTMTGAINFANNLGGITGQIGDNDYWRVYGNTVGSNEGYLEIATADDGNEPIYVRQYNGVFANIVRTATLLDESGNTHFPNTVYSGNGNSSEWQSAYSWGNHKAIGNNQYLGSDYVSGGSEKPNSPYFGAGKLKLQMLEGGQMGIPGFGWSDVLWMSSYTGSDVKMSTAIVSSKYNNRIGFVKQDYDAPDWGTFHEFYTTANFNASNYIPYVNSTQALQLAANNLVYTHDGSTVKVENSVAVFDHVYQGYYDGGSHKGVLSIKLPLLSTSTMLSMDISFYGYGSNYVGKVTVSFYIYDNAIYNVTGHIAIFETTSNFPTNQARVGVDSAGKVSVCFGDSSTEWDGYFSFKVDKLTTQYGGWNNDWNKGWSHSLEDGSFNGYPSLITPVTDIVATKGWSNGNFYKNHNGSIANQSELLSNGSQWASIGNTGNSFDGALSNKTVEGTFVNFNAYDGISKSLGFTLMARTSTEQGIYYKTWYGGGSQTWRRLLEAGDSSVRSIGFEQGNIDLAPYIYTLDGQFRWLVSQNSFPGAGNWSGSFVDTGRKTVTELGWKNYGNGHTIFDISNGQAPWGVNKSNKDAEIAWSESYPTLVGGNGYQTYGVRVDSARNADHLGNVTAGSYVMQTSLNAQLNGYATLNGVQTFTNTNTFDQSPIIPNGTLGTHAVNLNQLNGKANALENATGIGFSSGNYPSADGSQYPYMYFNNGGTQDYIALATQVYTRENFLNTPNGTSVIISGSNLNNYFKTGFYRGSGLANAPFNNGGWWYVAVEAHDSTWIKQTATSFGSGNMPNATYQRTMSGGNWSNWAQIWTTDNFNITNIQQWNYAYQYGLKVNEEFTANLNTGLVLADDYFGGESGIVDNQNGRLLATKMNEYYFYGSKHNDFDGLNFDLKKGLFGMGIAANDTDKLTVSGCVKASENFKSEKERPDTLFIPNGKLADLRDEIINDESDYSIRLDPHEYVLDGFSYLEIDDRSRLIHIIGEYEKMAVDFRKIYPKQQIVIYNFDKSGNSMEVKIQGKTIYFIEANCFLRLYVTKSLRVIAERMQPCDMVW
jgi:hypothetical protein